VLKAILRYDRGTIVIDGLAHIPFATLDPRTNVLRAQAMYYSDIVEYLKQSRIEYDDRVLEEKTMTLPFDHHHLLLRRRQINHNEQDYNDNDDNKSSSSKSFAVNNNNDLPQSLSSLSLRDYQQKAFDNWVKAGLRGCVVLPTGSGKTLVGIKAIQEVNAPSLVVVPTLDLMDQWTALLSKHFVGTKDVAMEGAEATGVISTETDLAKIGNLGGGAEDIQPITVSTYDSAYLRAPALGNKFKLVVFDEVHHLAALGYRTIAQQMAAPFRLGLTATIEREDELHRDLPKLVGHVVFQTSPDVLARQKHLAQYEIEKRKVELLPEELVQYKENMYRYHECLNKLGRSGSGSRSYYYTIPLEKLIMMSGKNPIAREALLARNKATNIALNSKSKLDELKEILAENKGVKTIIFTQYNSMVYEISNKFLIPFITYKTSKAVRQDVLSGFKDGRYMAVVTSKVLDEGVDVPDAELGIIVSGTGSAREFIQRLGRLLRPKPTHDLGDNRVSNSKKARLIEIVSLETREETVTSAKRKRAIKTIREEKKKQQLQDPRQYQGKEREEEGA
jgi:superfamily II DNA or RNA helicase